MPMFELTAKSVEKCDFWGLLKVVRQNRHSVDIRKSVGIVVIDPNHLIDEQGAWLA